MNTFKQRWQAWAMRIDALNFRERILVFVAAAGVAFSLMFIGLIEPALKRQETMLHTTTAMQQEILDLREQLATRERADSDGNDRELKQLRDAAATIERTVRQRETGLIPPEQMFTVMKSMLSGTSGLTLLSVETVPSQPAIPPLADSGEQTPPAGNTFYKHGITLRVAGGYAGLTDYLDRLERMPWTVQWESVQIDASRHPRLILTLKLNILGQEATWARL